MSDWTWDSRNDRSWPRGDRRQDDLWRADDPPHVEYVTSAGAEWLASASSFPRSVRALWSARPGAPSVLPCGTAFDVVNTSALFGRRMLERLWTVGPGCGPVAAHQGRMLLFAAPGTAERLPALLTWEEWDVRVPPVLCFGLGDAVTIPPLVPSPDGDAAEAGTGSGTHGGRRAASRWVIAPGTRHPWLPGAQALLRACQYAARPHPAAPDGPVPEGRLIDFSSPGSGC